MMRCYQGEGKVGPVFVGSFGSLPFSTILCDISDCLSQRHMLT